MQTDGAIYDAFTRGEFIEKDQEVVVVGEEGTSLKVKITDTPTSDNPQA